MSFTKPTIYKIVFMGDSGVGKSSIATRIVCNTFDACTEATIGASYFSKHIIKNGKSYNFNIWDTAGQEKYNCLVPLYYRNCDAAIIVYDITNNISYQTAKKRVPELRTKSSVEAIMFIGNKTDLQDRVVNKDDAEVFAKENNLLFFETSAKNSIHTKDILDKFLTILPPPKIITPSLPLIPVQSGFSCCSG
jgi:small GTP-binding protein